MQTSIDGTVGDDNLTGTSGADVFGLGQGGEDIALGGNDLFATTVIVVSPMAYFWLSKRSSTPT